MIPATVTLSSRLIPAHATGGPSGIELRRLTAALARGDDAAWSEFNHIYGPAIFRQLLALTRGDDDLAKEALQQTYLRVARHVRPCETETMFKAWLRTVARTALQDGWRRRRSFNDLLFRKHREPPQLSEPANDDRLLQLLDDALGRLETAERSLLEAKYYSGRDVRSLADSLHLTPKAVESRLTRARAALKRELLAALQQHE